MSTETEPRKVRVDGVDLAYIEQGTGEPAIFVHGGFGDFRSSAHFVSAFSRTYRAISYSLRYHYPNGWLGDGADYAIPVHAQDLSRLIEQLGASPAHLIGASYGGRVALHVARDRPELVRTLVLAEPALGAWLREIPGGPAILDEIAKNYFEPAKRAIEAGNLGLATQLMVEGVAGEGTFERIPGDVRRRFMDNIRVQGIPSSPAPFSRDDAKLIRAPVLLLNGERTVRLFRLVNDELEKHLPNVERVRFPGANHLMAVFYPDEFTRTVLAFLAKH